jgi:hypothetical protein
VEIIQRRNCYLSVLYIKTKGQEIQNYINLPAVVYGSEVWFLNYGQKKNIWIYEYGEESKIRILMIYTIHQILFIRSNTQVGMSETFSMQWEIRHI